MKSPCYNCTSRFPGCACESYQKWLIEYRKAKQNILKESHKDKVLNEWRFDTIQKMKKRGREKWRTK